MGFLRLGRYLPSALQNALFGDRARHGPVADEQDPDWQFWRKIDLEFYDQNQRESAGAIVNASGYRVMKKVALGGQTVLEIGPGSLDHMTHWAANPKLFYAVDINLGFLDRATEKLAQNAVDYERVVTNAQDGGKLPLADASVDVVLSFYSLEHLHPLSDYLDEIDRVLKPGGRLAGAIPCEGGIGWGLGRYLTTRRWLLAKGVTDPGKIIAWEHPNFADLILSELNHRFEREYVGLWPFVLPVIDFNLIARFVFVKPRK